MISVACALGITLWIVALPNVVQVVRMERSFGVGLDDGRASPAFGSTMLTAVKLRPGGPLALAGVAPGDQIALDPRDARFGHVGLASSDEVAAARPVRVTVVRGTLKRTILMRPALEAYRPDFLLVNTTAYGIAPVLVGFALLVAWRAPPSRASRALALLLMFRGLSTVSGADLSQPALPRIIDDLGVALWAPQMYFLSVFAVAFPVPHPNDLRRYLDRYGLPPLALLLAVVGVCTFADWSGRSTSWLAGLAIPAAVVATATPLLALVEGWRHSTGADRQRFQWIGLAFAALFGLPLALGAGWTVHGFLIGAVVQPLGVIAGAALLTYAVARHRVVDLGFIINRAAVYGVTSGILLLSFGLLEWAAERLLAFKGREENMVLDAALALGVFLAFHRVRDIVSEWIERIFFHHWRLRDAALKRFVREAGVFTRPDALLGALHKAISAYGEAGSVGIYLRGDGGVFARIHGAGPDGLEPDAPIPVGLRAERRVVELRPSEPSLASLAAPMIVGAELRGFVLIGAKADGAAYRADEVELIGWAVETVGHDLNVLRVVELESAVRELEIRNDELSRVLRLA